MTELSAAPFSVGVSQVARGRYLVRVTGELDLTTAAHVRTAVLELLELRADRISLDCSEMSFIDSSGIGVLVGAEKRARSQACEFVVCRPSAAVMRVLDQTGVSRHLTFA
ncbi:MAG: STAS domain-containing protein [Acidimicrobiia bacterium]